MCLAFSVCVVADGWSRKRGAYALLGPGLRHELSAIPISLFSCKSMCWACALLQTVSLGNEGCALLGPTTSSLQFQSRFSHAKVLNKVYMCSVCFVSSVCVVVDGWSWKRRVRPARSDTDSLQFQSRFPQSMQKWSFPSRNSLEAC